MGDDKAELIPSSSIVTTSPQRKSTNEKEVEQAEKAKQEESETGKDSGKGETNDKLEVGKGEEGGGGPPRADSSKVCGVERPRSTSITQLPTKLVSKVVEKIHATASSISIGGGKSDASGGGGRRNSTSATAESSTRADQGTASNTAAPTLYQKFVTSFEAALQDLTSGELEERKPRQRLPSLDLEGVAAYIKEDSPRHVIFMVGAGISTSAGIPDFRSPGSGLYASLRGRFNLPDPQMIFDLSHFRRDPEPFYVLMREMFHDGVRPTTTHHFIRLMDEKGLLRRCFTQNIDSLEYTAGVNNERVVTAHGSHHTSTCLSCKRKYTREWLDGKLTDKDKVVPRCDGCNGVVKPDIIFFGEKLPNRFFSAALADFPKCDLLIIMGTSLCVQPFASLVGQVPKDCPRLLINLTPAGRHDVGFFGFGDDDGAGLSYGMEDNVRDVFWQGSCDEGAERLARMLGWEVELKALMKKGQKDTGGKTHPDKETDPIEQPSTFPLE